MAYLVDYFMVFIISYLIGSIPFSWIITKLKTGKDLRKIGSGNVGGRNVYRATKSLWWALIAGLLDVSRTFLAVWIPYYLVYKLDTEVTGLHSGRYILLVAGIAAAIGHNWPYYLHSHGGRGITVVVGTAVFLNPFLIPIWIGLWLICIIIIGYSSITYIVVTFLTGIVGYFIPLVSWVPIDNLSLCLLYVILSLIMLSRQGDNIRKIRQGEAKKIDLIKVFKKKSKLSEEILH